MRVLAASILLFTLTSLGCHPLRRIDMVNNTNDTVRFVWTLNKDSLSNNPFLLSNSDELTFALIPPKTPAIRFSFGAGNWSPSEVQKLTGFLQSLEIVSASQRIKIDSLPRLREFLLSRRKGIGGARIEIAITEPNLNLNKK